MILIPIGHDKLVVERLPFATMGIILSLGAVRGCTGIQLHGGTKKKEILLKTV